MLRNSEGKIMVARLGYFFAGEIIIGIILIALLIPTSLPATYFLLKFSRLTLSVTFNIFMYLKLFSYKNKIVDVFLYVYFLISIYFIANMGNISPLQWIGHKIGIYFFNIEWR